MSREDGGAMFAHTHEMCGGCYATEDAVAAARATPQTPAATVNCLCRGPGTGHDRGCPAAQTPVVDPGVCGTCKVCGGGFVDGTGFACKCPESTPAVDPGPCAPWCGTDRNAVKLLRPLPESWSRRDGDARRSFCSPACRDRGRPRASTGRAVRLRDDAMLRDIVRHYGCSEDADEGAVLDAIEEHLAAQHIDAGRKERP